MKMINNLNQYDILAVVENQNKKKDGSVDHNQKFVQPKNKLLPKWRRHTVVVNQVQRQMNK